MLFCDFAREAAVASSYLALDGPAIADPEPDAWELFSNNDERDAFRVSLRVEAGGVGGFSPECDF